MKKFVETLKQTGRAIRAMNLPNKLTLLRVAMVPLYLVLLWFFDNDKSMQIWPLLVFVAASLTDMLDGRIARSRNLITNFGKFMDPLADKLLVCSGLICFVGLGQLPAWFVIIIISREFIISGFRLVASDNGVVIAASYWGKFKTVSQMIMSVLLIVNIPALSILTTIFSVIALVLTVVSLIDYIAKNYRVLTEGSL